MEIVPLLDLDTPGGTVSPRVVRSTTARAVVIRLDPGQSLGEHEVREEAWLLVLDGAVQVAGPRADDPPDGPVESDPGTMLVFEPHERHSVSSERGATVLLVLTPWPAPDHYDPDAPHEHPQLGARPADGR